MRFAYLMSSPFFECMSGEWDEWSEHGHVKIIFLMARNFFHSVWNMFRLKTCREVRGTGPCRPSVRLATLTHARTHTHTHAHTRTLAHAVLQPRPRKRAGFSRDLEQSHAVLNTPITKGNWRPFSKHANLFCTECSPPRARFTPVGCV